MTLRQFILISTVTGIFWGLWIVTKAGSSFFLSTFCRFVYLVLIFFILFRLVFGSFAFKLADFGEGTTGLIAERLILLFISMGIGVFTGGVIIILNEITEAIFPSKEK